jgi:hypothetical protein
MTAVIMIHNQIMTFSCDHNTQSDNDSCDHDAQSDNDIQVDNDFTVNDWIYCLQNKVQRLSKRYHLH